MDLLGQISLLFGQIIISYLIGQITICSDELGLVRTYTVLGFIRTNSKSLFIRINNFVQKYVICPSESLFVRTNRNSSKQITYLSKQMRFIFCIWSFQTVVLFTHFSKITFNNFFVLIIDLKLLLKWIFMLNILESREILNVTVTFRGRYRGRWNYMNIYIH